MNGLITPAQFADLNAKWWHDIDYNAQPQRTGPIRRIDGGVSIGYLNQANNLHVPSSTFAHQQRRDHDTYHSWSMRARLDAPTAPRQPDHLDSFTVPDL